MYYLVVTRGLLRCYCLIYKRWSLSALIYSEWIGPCNLVMQLYPTFDQGSALSDLPSESIWISRYPSANRLYHKYDYNSLFMAELMRMLPASMTSRYSARLAYNWAGTFDVTRLEAKLWVNRTRGRSPYVCPTIQLFEVSVLAELTPFIGT